MTHTRQRQRSCVHKSPQPGKSRGLVMCKDERDAYLEYLLHFNILSTDKDR